MQENICRHEGLHLMEIYAKFLLCLIANGNSALYVWLGDFAGLFV